MTIRRLNTSEIVRRSIDYLAENTDITFFGQGSIARALVEATATELSRLQDYVDSTLENSKISTAGGLYLDLFGETLGIPRIRENRAFADFSDGAVRLYVEEGTLGSRLSSGDPSRGVVPVGTVISNAEGTVQFEVTEDTFFPVNSRSAFVSVRALNSGANFNVGANQLDSHNLSDGSIKVTNDLSINTGSDLEADEEYRFRLTRALTSRFGSNQTAVQVAANSQPGVATATIVPFSRGAGTFDVLLIPQGNRLSNAVIQNVQRAVEEVAPFGISVRIREPEYVSVKLTVQVIFEDTVADGRRAVLRNRVQSSIIQYLNTIPVGGTLVVNRIREAVLSTSSDIRDLRILEMCLDKKSRTLRNIELEDDQLITIDNEVEDPIAIV